MIKLNCDEYNKNCPFCESDKFEQREYKGLSVKVNYCKCLNCKKEFNRRVLNF